MSEQPVTIIDGNVHQVPTRRFYRSSTDRVAAGVCGGIGEYLGIDTGLVRVLWGLSSVLTVGLMALAYVILAVVIPQEPADYAATKQVKTSDLWQRIRSNRGLLWGGLLILAGIVLLLNNFGWLPIRLEAIWSTFWALFLPLLLVGLGVVLLLTFTGRAPDWGQLRRAGAGLPIRRSRDDRIIAGVCGDLAQYLKVNATIVRIAWAAISVLTVGTVGVLLYAAAALFVPLED